MSGNPFAVLGSSSKMPKASNSPSPAGGLLDPNADQQQQAGRRKKSHRAGKKKRARRKSFAVGHDDSNDEHMPPVPRDSFYSLHGRNLSGTSIDSEALLDHRDQPSTRIRRSSTMGLSTNLQSSYAGSRLRTAQANHDSDNDDHADPWDEGAPLLSNSNRARGPNEPGGLQYSTYLGSERSRPRSRPASSRSSRQRTPFGIGGGGPAGEGSYNVNYPPSVPASPTQGPADRGLDMSFGDAMLRDELSLGGGGGGSASPHGSEDDEGIECADVMGPLLEPSPQLVRRNTMVHAEQDVCFPTSGMSELADDELNDALDAGPGRRYGERSSARRRRRKWPDLHFLKEWSHLEKEGRTDERRVKRITEPQLVNGRLRPVHKNWYRSEEDAPYRFTYFNEVVQSTIHAQTISELVQPGGSFEELFRPDPVLLTDESESESDESDEEPTHGTVSLHHLAGTSPMGEFKIPTRQHSLQGSTDTTATARREGTMSPTQVSGISSQVAASEASEAGGQTPLGVRSPSLKKEPWQPGASTTGRPTPDKEKAPRYGERPVWWLDVLSPTEAEMKMLAKVFGIHPLTGEDIMQQEAREKVELFRHYYFVNYRTFDQDIYSENYLAPVNFYILVFREGVLSFHFSMTPHCANVRRRVRQLKDYMRFSADWISYGLIDDITDVFGPLIQNIEEEVDEIDDAILRLHSSSDERLKHPGGGGGNGGGDGRKLDEKTDDGATAHSDGDMLRRVGDCRKRVMGLYRLLGNKADVIKGFAKRCNEQWDVAPRSDIGMFLGDIQDHIVTMTGNLSHYEKILARSHQNYLAQINIRMNERQEQTADVLGRLTVLGTIVLPMNIITGLWGMNVWVPGQEAEGDLRWFVVITGGLLCFGLICYYLAKRVYNIV